MLSSIDEVHTPSGILFMYFIWSCRVIFVLFSPAPTVDSVSSN
jgi:hypothetical protein